MTQPDMTTPAQPWGEVPSTLIVRGDGKLLYDDTLVGRLDGDRITLNLGWMAAAGFHVTLEADPKVDRIRSGIVLER